MHGRKSTPMKWHDQLKIAILQKDSKQCYELITKVPTEELTETEELLSARELIAQGIELLKQERQEVQDQMLQIKLAQKFLK
ncbi:Uncharacterised protein [Helicobacter mustelae]|nr:Uncharacterised protein [Helicobacter mustelae]